MPLRNFKKVPRKRVIHSFIQQTYECLLYPGQKTSSDPKPSSHSSHGLAPVVGTRPGGLAGHPRPPKGTGGHELMSAEPRGSQSSL